LVRPQEKPLLLGSPVVVVGRVPPTGQIKSSLCFQVAQEIWVCEKQTITKWPGDILAYKEHLKSKLVDEEPQLTKRTHNV
jgi:hypothetical protein